jgi:hypothetical protein
MSATEADLNRWIANGTLDRIAAAIRDRTPVQIKRTSGEMVTGYAVENGFAGMGVSVAWGPGAEEWTREGGGYRFPKGVNSKVVRTEDLLAWNPWFGARALNALSPFCKDC